MGIYEHNIKLLQALHPYLYKRLTRRKTPRFVLESREGSKVPVITVRDERGRFYLHSPYYPEEEANKIINSVPIQEISSLWIMGLGMGHHLLELLNRRDRSFFTVVVESDPELFDVFLHTNAATHALQWPYFKFSTGTEEEIEQDIEDILHTHVNFKMGKVHFLNPPSFERYDGQTYRKLIKKVIEFTKYRYYNLGNSVEDTLDGLRNSFLSLDVLSGSPGILDLQGKYRGRPAIIVSAGPSLDKNIDLLAEAKGKALIISTDTTFPVLLKKGIIPELVTTVERIPEVYHRFYEKVVIPEETWLAALNVTDPRVFDRFPNQHLLCIRATEPLSNWIDEITGKKAGIRTSLSTSHLGFSVAEVMGCDPIILVGQDLALGEKDQYYVSGTDGSSKGEDYSGTVWVKDYDGNLIKSTRWLKIFKEWFDMRIPNLDITCIDATEGGAYIEGTVVMTLREVLDKYCLSTPELPRIKDLLTLREPIPTVKLIDELIGLGKNFESIVDIIEDKIDILTVMKKDFVDDEAKLVISVQDILNELFTIIYSNPRVAFFLQALILIGITRLSNWGNLKDGSKASEFVEYAESLLLELRQSAEICGYEVERLVNTIRYSSNW